MTTKITENAPIDSVIYRSAIDGALVVQIDTEDDTGRVRVDLNEGTIYDGIPEEHRNALATLEMVGSAYDVFQQGLITTTEFTVEVAALIARHRDTKSV